MFIQSVHEGGKFVSRTHWPHLSQEICLIHISVGSWAPTDPYLGFLDGNGFKKLVTEYKQKSRTNREWRYHLEKYWAP